MLPAIHRMLNLNINAVIKNVHAVLPHMIERRIGDIVVTCSFAGHSAIKQEPVDPPPNGRLLALPELLVGK